MPKQGKLISFEGSEACGKTTQIESTADWLQENGIEVIRLREPGGTSLGEAIRYLLKHDPAGTGMSPEAELLLFEASRAELVRKIITPALTHGKWVLTDRFFDSTTVYQGIARGLGAHSVQAINQFAAGNVAPDLTLLLDIPVSISQHRMVTRSQTEKNFDRLEAEPSGFYEKVREGYLTLAKQEPKRIKLIPADGTPEQVFESIQKEIKNAFPSL